MATKLGDLEHDARANHGGKAAKAGWAGLNAAVTKEFISKTAKEFADAAYYDRDRTADAMEHADRIAKLLTSKGDDMSPEEFDELNPDLAKYKDARLFQETLATTIGPRGLLDLWADLADPSDDGTLQRSRHDQFGDFQRNLSLTLAGAPSPTARRMGMGMGVGTPQLHAAPPAPRAGDGKRAHRAGRGAMYLSRPRLPPPSWPSRLSMLTTGLVMLGSGSERP
ncbi:hypothetical protein ACFV1H_09810 [Streptomyces virginiae]|uniref:hypothetical protein n=2 Tax=Streptomyces TaxID=1883 RepID=UPI0036A2CCF6